VSEPAFVLRAAGFLALLAGAGWAVARVGRRKVDLFAAVWWGLAIVSVAGVLLGRTGQFSLTALAFVLGAVGSGAAVISAMRDAVSPDADRREVVSPWVSRIAWIAAAVTFAWCWPPFETFIF
jgi:hypothetical protein